MFTLQIDTIEEIEKIAGNFLDYLRDKTGFFENTTTVRCLAFYGEMGVGKTTFIKALCNKLGVLDVVNSPSFAIINEYSTVDNDTIYHFDFYRIKKTEEIYDFGYEDYFYSGNICFFEWPEKIRECLPVETVNVVLEERESGSRILKITHN